MRSHCGEKEKMAGPLPSREELLTPRVDILVQASEAVKVEMADHHHQRWNSLKLSGKTGGAGIGGGGIGYESTGSGGNGGNYYYQRQRHRCRCIWVRALAGVTVTTEEPSIFPAERSPLPEDRRLQARRWCQWWR